MTCDANLELNFEQAIVEIRDEAGAAGWLDKRSATLGATT
jgi:hypothetical protein